MTKLPQPGAALAAIRTVWDMSPELVEFAYRCRHLNTYVYAALLALQTSAWPREGRRRLVRGRYPEDVQRLVDEILSLLPAVRQGAEPRRTRLRLTHLLNELYVTIPRLSVTEVSGYMKLLAALAFVSLQADRADNQPLWFHPPVRQMSPEMQQRFAATQKAIPFDEVAKGPYAEELKNRGVRLDNPLELVNAATILFVQPAILASEGGVSPDRVLKAYENIEQGMRQFERRHGLSLRPGESLDARRAGLLRYRNTLYLYGGNHIERMGHTDRARQWYLREIDTPELPELLRFYLTSMKTIERLLRAYVLTPMPKLPPLRLLIERSLVVTLQRAADYCRNVLDLRRRQPDLDWSNPRVRADGTMTFFGGEATREPLLIALIHQRIIEGVRYADTDYSLFEPV